MGNVLKLLFFSGIAIVLYTYVGYGLILFAISKLRRNTPHPAGFPSDNLPAVTLVVAAYNEEEFIEKKIANTMALDYPAEKLQMLFVTDGSTDRTPQLVAANPRIMHFHERERRGKIHAVNRVMPLVKTPITVFCDANTLLNDQAIRNIVRHYTDASVGGVSGEKRIMSNEKEAASGSGEGLYWRYESFLKRKDAEVYSLVGAAGELFSIRTELYEPPPMDSIIEDFHLSMTIVSKGFRFAYEPEAYAMESASASVEEEWKRKVRICAGGFQSMLRLAKLLNPFKYGILTFQYISHRVLRWTLAPVFLVVILITNLLLAFTDPSPLYKISLMIQVVFYAIAASGHFLRNRKIQVKGFFVPYYFAVMNAAVFAGAKRYFSGKQSVLWERAKRA